LKMFWEKATLWVAFFVFGMADLMFAHDLEKGARRGRRPLQRLGHLKVSATVELTGVAG
jgi:hypothetical protein